MKTYNDFITEAGKLPKGTAHAYVRNPYNDRTAVLNLIWDADKRHDVALSLSAKNGKKIYDYLVKNKIRNLEVQVSAHDAEEQLKALDYVKQKGIRVTYKNKLRTP